jgi:hypothetical protein
MKQKEIIVVWFSCGAASAVAAKKTLELYSDKYDVRIATSHIKQEDDDNFRFLVDVEVWLGVKIELAMNPRYPTGDAEQVWEDRRYMSGINGAPCTKELKKEARYEWERIHNPHWHVMGFTVDEKGRFNRFKLMERENTLPVLIDLNLTKQDCYNILLENGIRPPRTYEMGFPNANCKGCVKATSPTYWNHVRKHFPDDFDKRSKMSRRLGVKLVRYKGKRIFLEELPVDAVGKPMAKMNIECGIFCDINKTL